MRTRISMVPDCLKERAWQEMQRSALLKYIGFMGRKFSTMPDDFKVNRLRRLVTKPSALIYRAMDTALPMPIFTIPQDWGKNKNQEPALL